MANGAIVVALPDTGADRTACGMDVLNTIGMDQDNLRAADGHTYE